MSDILKKQIKLLADWNAEHIKTDPEQVRKNIDTLVNALCYLQ